MCAIILEALIFLFFVWNVQVKGKSSFLSIFLIFSQKINCLTFMHYFRIIDYIKNLHLLISCLYLRFKTCSSHFTSKCRIYLQLIFFNFFHSLVHTFSEFSYTIISLKPDVVDLVSSDVLNLDYSIRQIS